MGRRFDAVLFDAGETIVHPEPSFPELIAILLERRGLRVAHRGETIQKALDHAFLTLNDRGEPFSISPEISRRFWTRLYLAVLGELGVRDESDALAAYLYHEFSNPEHYAPFPDALAAMRELRAQGYRLGVVSNWEAWLPRLLSRLGFAPLLEVTVVSGAEGFEKPDPRLFRLALEQLGLTPERCVYVGDNPQVDIEPAVALGMHAVLVDRRGRYGHLPSVASLYEVQAVIA